MPQPKALPNGNVLKDIQIAFTGKFDYGGEKFEMTESIFDKFIEAFKGMQAIGRKFLPVWKGHPKPDERHKEPLVGKIHGIFHAGGVLWARVEFIATFWKEIAAGMWEGASIEFAENYKEYTGELFDWSLVGLAITNDGFLPVNITLSKDLKFTFGEAQRVLCLSAPLTITAPQQEDSIMEKVLSALNVTTEKDALAKVIELTKYAKFPKVLTVGDVEYSVDDITKLAKDRDTLKAAAGKATTEKTAAESDVKKLTNKVDNLTTTIEGQEAARLIDEGIDEGVLLPKHFARYTKDAEGKTPDNALKDLADSPYQNLTGLQRQIATGKPVVELNKRRGSSGSPIEPTNHQEVEKAFEDKIVECRQAQEKATGNPCTQIEAIRLAAAQHEDLYKQYELSQGERRHVA